MSREDSLALLYAQHSARAYSFAYTLTGDRGLAEDLVQDAFVKVAGRLRTVEPEAFGGYLHRTIVNLATSRWRRLEVERRHLPRLAAPASLAPQQLVVELRQSLHHELLRLPVRQRVAIVARYYLDWSDEDIADALRCRPGTVRSLVSRGLATLRPAFADDADYDSDAAVTSTTSPPECGTGSST